MKPIVWLASFPKSGNTWVRFLLGNYLDEGSPEGIDINQLRLGTVAAWRAIFDEWSAVASSDLDDDEVFGLRADVARHVAAVATSTIYLKVHDAFYRRPDGAVAFPHDVTNAVVYIVRNPLDVAVSLSHHMNVNLSHAVDHLCDETYALSRGRERLGMSFTQPIGSWSSHYRSWIGSGLPVTVIRYEDLQADPAAMLERILRTVGEDVDRSRVERAVARSSFSELQQQEQRKGFTGCRSRDVFFFRTGRMGDGRRELSADDQRRLTSAHGPLMRELGYLDSQPTEGGR